VHSELINKVNIFQFPINLSIFTTRAYLYPWTQKLDYPNSKEVADTNWTKLLPKIKLLSAKEAESRTGLREVLTKQREEIATFSDEIGMFVTLEISYM